jgi:hypothetical protein
MDWGIADARDVVLAICRHYAYWLLLAPRSSILDFVQAEDNA